VERNQAGSESVRRVWWRFARRKEILNCLRKVECSPHDSCVERLELCLFCLTTSFPCSILFWSGIYRQLEMGFSVHAL
jgi:hypothetical protein